jgi:hypothetical protein
MWNAYLSSLTLLVRLAPPQGDRYALEHLFDVGAINCTKFRPLERASEADQEEGSVATVPQTVAEGRQYGQNVRFGYSGDPALGSAVSAADAFHGHGDQRGTCWRAHPLDRVGLADRHQPAGEGRNGESVSVDGKVLSDALRRCWYASTPSEEVVEVRLVGSSRAVGDGIPQVSHD